MAAPNPTLYKYALELVKFYNTIPTFRAAFPRLFNQPRITYKNWPLKLYVRLIATIDRQYIAYTKQQLNADNTGELLTKFWKNPLSFKKLEQGVATNAHLFPELDHQELTRIEQLPEGEARHKVIEAFLEKKDKEEAKPDSSITESTHQPTTPTITPTSTPPNIVTNAIPRKLPFKFQIPTVVETSIKRFATPTRLATVLSTTLGGIIGYAIGGGQPLVTMAGAGAGGLFPSYIKNGGGRSILNGLKGSANVAQSLLSGVAKVNPYTATASILIQYRKPLIAVVAAIFLLFILIPGGLLNSTSFFPPFKQDIGFAAPTTNTPANQLKITKTGPPSGQVENGANITYSIKVTYTGSGKADIKVTDPIPAQTDFVEAPAGPETAAGASSGSSVEWDLTQIPPNQTQELTLTVKPNTDDIYVTNPGASASITKTYGNPTLTGGSCPTPQQLADNAQNPQTCQYLNPPIDIFNTNFTDAQVQQYITTYQPNSGRSLDDFTSKVQIMVDEAKSVGLNPIIPLAYWVTESGFGNGLGCIYVPQDFKSQVDCILGGPTGSTFTDKYSVGAGCARSKDANSPACIEEAGLRKSHSAIYNSIPINIPISTFDDLLETIGSRAPDLETYNCANGDKSACQNPINRNCTSTYNLFIKVAQSVNACVVTATPNTDSTQTDSGSSGTTPDQ